MPTSCCTQPYVPIVHTQCEAHILPIIHNTNTATCSLSRNMSHPLENALYVTESSCHLCQLPGQGWHDPKLCCAEMSHDWHCFHFIWQHPHPQTRLTETEEHQMVEWISARSKPILVKVWAPGTSDSSFRSKQSWGAMMCRDGCFGVGGFVWSGPWFRSSSSQQELTNIFVWQLMTSLY